MERSKGMISLFSLRLAANPHLPLRLTRELYSTSVFDVQEWFEKQKLNASLPESRWWRAKHWNDTFEIDRVLESVERLGLDAVLFNDPAFPPLLKSIFHPPKLVFVQGTLPQLPALTIVGTRHPSSYGLAITQSLVRETATKTNQGIAIISGLAYGIDAAAHRAALASHIPTVAILPSGHDRNVLYPPRHRALAEEILANGGALLSERPPLEKAAKHDFIIRNRLIAGFSLATLVVEAARKSGSLVTAQYALDFGREVLAVPGDITSAQSIGCHHLLRQGAGLCLEANDLLEALHLSTAPRPPRLDDEQSARLLDILSIPLHSETLAQRCFRPLPEVLAHLSRLALEGWVEEIDTDLWQKTQR